MNFTTIIFTALTFLKIDCSYHYKVNTISYSLVLESAILRKGNIIYASLPLSFSTTRLMAKKSIQERLLSHERKDSEGFSVGIGIIQAFHSRRSFRNFHENLEEMFFDGVSKGHVQENNGIKRYGLF